MLSLQPNFPFEKLLFNFCKYCYKEMKCIKLQAADIFIT